MDSQRQDYNSLLNPDIRNLNDPPLGERVPARLQIFFETVIRASTLSPTIGAGVFAGEPIPKGAVVFVNSGQLVSDASKQPPGKNYLYVYDETRFIAPVDYAYPGPGFLLNHSCAPNLKIVGRIVGVAKNDIEPGAELSADYATLKAGAKGFAMECHCGQTNCRHVITSEDWKNEDFFYDRMEEWPTFVQRMGMKLFEG